MATDDDGAHDICAPHINDRSGLTTCRRSNTTLTSAGITDTVKRAARICKDYRGVNRADIALLIPMGDRHGGETFFTEYCTLRKQLQVESGVQRIAHTCNEQWYNNNLKAIPHY